MPDPEQPYIGPAPSFYPKLPLGLRWGLAFIWLPENDGRQHDSAPGERFRTSWGVTQPVWDACVQHGIVEGDLAAATRDQCAAIYLSQFWNTMMAGQLPPAVGFCLFCDGTLTGTGHIVRLLQQIIGVTPDGVVGRKETLPAVINYCANHTSHALCDALISANTEYLESLPNAALFIRGWTRREKQERIWVRSMPDRLWA